MMPIPKKLRSGIDATNEFWHPLAHNDWVLIRGITMGFYCLNAVISPGWTRQAYVCLSRRQVGETMKYPSEFYLSGNYRENWLHIDLGHRKRVAIVCEAIGMYAIKAVIPLGWNKWLLGFLDERMRK